MAESQVVAKQALTEKLEDQLTCAVCLDTFTEPKLLPCFHVFCKGCLERLVVTDREGEVSLSCPTCRKSTLLSSATGVSGLQSAFHIHHLFEIQDAVKNLKPQTAMVKIPQNVLCEKCTKTTRSATNYCHDCGQYICEMCTNMHVEWKEFSAHKLVTIEELCHQGTVKKVVAMPKEGALYCSLHNGQELDIYCETCEELICVRCTISKHCKPKHKYEPVEDIVKQCKGEIMASLASVEKQVSTASKTLKQIETEMQELNDQQRDCEGRIQREIKRFQEILESRKTELLGKLDQQIQQRTRELLEQKEKIEMAQTQLVSCLTFVEDSVKAKSHGELVQTKKTLLKQIAEATHRIDEEELLPPSRMKVKFIAASSELALACQQYGEVCFDREKALVSPQNCYATGRGLKVTEVGEKAIVTLHISGIGDKDVTSSPPAFLACNVVSESTSERTSCTIAKLDTDRSEVSYKLTHRGRHNLHVKVSGEHIKGNPFSVVAFKRLGTPAIKFIGQGCVKWPWGIAFNQRGDIIVVEGADCCVSFFKPSGVKFLSFGRQGTGEGEFKLPRCIAVDNDGNILITDKFNSNLQKFTSEGRFIASTMGKTSRGELKFGRPRGITIHATTECT